MVAVVAAAATGVAAVAAVVTSAVAAVVTSAVGVLAVVILEEAASMSAAAILAAAIVVGMSADTEGVLWLGASGTPALAGTQALPSATPIAARPAAIAITQANTLTIHTTTSTIIITPITVIIGTTGIMAGLMDGIPTTPMAITAAVTTVAHAAGCIATRSRPTATIGGPDTTIASATSATDRT